MIIKSLEQEGPSMTSAVIKHQRTEDGRRGVMSALMKEGSKRILVLTFLFDIRNPVRKPNPVNSGFMLPLQLIASL